jgi:hypothetical protein
MPMRTHAASRARIRLIPIFGMERRNLMRSPSRSAGNPDCS